MFWNNTMIKASAAVAVALMLCVAVSPAFYGGSDAASHGSYSVQSSTVNLQPGQSWQWTPQFPEGLSPVMTVKTSDSEMPSGTDGYAATSSAGGATASVSGGTLTVSIPSNYAAAHFFVSIRATTTQPSQAAFYDITFVVASYELSYPVDTVVAKVGTPITTLVPTLTGGVAANSYSINGTLPAGLSFDTSTGAISGTPTAYKAQTTYTVTANLGTVPPQSVETTISIGAFADITAADYYVYAITGQTSVSVPGVAMPSGTVLDSMTLVATENGSSVSVSVGTAYKGLTVAADTGAVSGTPSVAGTYVFTESFTATAATGGSTASRAVTVVVEDKVAISGDAMFYSYEGHSDSVTLSKSAGPSGVAWSIDGITKDGSAIASGSDFSSISLSGGVLTSSAATSPGTYVVTVKLATTSTVQTTSGATGASPADNYATKAVTIVVRPAAAFTAVTGGVLDDPFYMATNQVYDALTIGSNLGSAATFAATAYGSGITADNISVAADGTVTPGSAPVSTAGDYSITVTVTDNYNPTNTASATLPVEVANALTFLNDTVAGFIME